MTMYEYLCFDPDWERKNTPHPPRDEDEWWDERWQDREEAEAEAMAVASRRRLLFAVTVSSFPLP